MSTNNEETKVTAEPIPTPTTSRKRRTWAQQSYGDKISQAQVVIATAREYLPQLTKRGIDDALIGRLDELVRLATESNNRQESLKGELKKTTASIDTIMTEMGSKLAEIKKMVKIEVPKPEWKKFGFEDVR